jgi:hypothetical protein
MCSLRHATGASLRHTTVLAGATVAASGLACCYGATHDSHTSSGEQGVPLHSNSNACEYAPTLDDAACTVRIQLHDVSCHVITAASVRG